MSEIIPCPFCGGEAVIKRSWIPNNKYVAVGCGSDKPCPAKNDEQDEQGGFSCEFPTEEEAIDNWNKRAIEDALSLRIAELEKAYMKIDDEMDNLLLEREIETAKLKAKIVELRDFIDRLIEAGNALDVPPDDFSEEQKEWREIVSEWKECEK